MFHGLVATMFLAIVVAENHPLEKYRKAGPDVMIVYLIAHLLYGLSLGLFFYWWVPIGLLA
jgi:hypothetical protein